MACLIGVMSLVALGLAYQHHASAPAGAVVHLQRRFQLRIPAPMKTVAPLFGANAERGWAGAEWDPQFLFPATPGDVEGMVFTVKHHPGHNSVWVNTIFDLEKGHVQYVYVIPDVLVTRIDIHITKRDESNTNVNVLYERTALALEANSQVEKMAQADAKAGPEWEAQIKSYLARSGRD